MPTSGLRKPKLGGAVYILPNLLTTGNLFFGYFSIIKSLQTQFAVAAIAILLATIFDVLDGRVARLTNGTSEFGVQYDSLCDLVSFGLAPAFLMYQFGLNGMGRIGWVVCFIFLACGALRLARFNVQSSIGKANGDFTGLPIPMAAAVVACFVAFATHLTENHGGDSFLSRFIYENLMFEDLQVWFFLVFGPFLALMMVSNISYRSHKTLRIQGIRPFKMLAGAVVVIGLVAIEPEIAGFAFFFIYFLSGPFEWIVGWKKPVDEDDIFEKVGETGDTMFEPPSSD